MSKYIMNKGLGQLRESLSSHLRGVIGSWLGVFEVFEELFLAAGEFGGDGDYKADVLVPAAGAAKVGYAFAAQAKQGAGLGAGADFELKVAVGGGDFDGVAQSGLGEGNGLVNEQIGAISFENVVGLDFDGDVKIFKADPGAVVGAGRDLDRILSPLVDNLSLGAFDRFHKVDGDAVAGQPGSSERRSAAEKGLKNLKGVGEAAKVEAKTAAGGLVAGSGVSISKRPLAVGAGASAKTAKAGRGVESGVAELVVGLFLFRVG
ncbi:MAG: hypothetical protein UX85_C0001G0072 [Candidatus Beckwithbacteria bacterium GW2011_GWB1_47_15]|uniref:Uncharacterized protein n=1 Tax=Candidatus Beckwithbacteria bacterium GW2011_GWB1_47_15 TaxID=1618371 RepID=A0A0G1U6H5_9BACT|nr:hypothetical protein [uncultured bacterium]KKU35894.1 MAG: hypothetical protein UX50_C0001G0071 [Candidatus Beckwithbacteria bacterium GW2011_GWA1_46_30]KKU61858.1 MAG: hypothetical protein UX85_C0001G0072 [Candidatus Beckwithbacteria bacterium GW2011_GWB1_47_15]KKU72588.1 MAG: hypothetical protein UX97_C0001G0458 [Candidatus Beckwithbacteria bacterium GW2011_GWA2_47_25]KKW04245.1 MAG: hypothetical protein UY37_C0003G0076 [Candidatus Beckwithbacteria bacterium GW2011_GWC2_49_11]